MGPSRVYTSQYNTEEKIFQYFLCMSGNISIEYPYLVDECASVQAGYLAPSNIWHFQIGVQQQIEWERQIFAGIIDADMEM